MRTWIVRLGPIALVLFLASCGTGGSVALDAGADADLSDGAEATDDASAGDDGGMAGDGGGPTEDDGGAEPSCEDQGLTACTVDGRDVCVDTARDPDHCGDCETVCDTAAGSMCVDSACTETESPLGALGPAIELYAGRNPDIAADSNGDPHLVFDRRGVGVFYAKGSGTGGQFPATATRLGQHARAIEPRIFIDGEDVAHVVWALSTGGGNVGGYEGYYTNNAGGAWKAPLLVAALGDGDTGDGGLTRVSCGRVVRLPGQDLAVTAWMGGGGAIVLASVEGLATTPVVRKKVRTANNFPLGMVALSPSMIRTTFRHLPGAVEAIDYDLDLNSLARFDVIRGPFKGECADAFLDGTTGMVHYTGTAKGNSGTPSRVWYTNDERIAQNEPILGMVVAEEGGTPYFWADVCVDARGHPYLTHSYIDTEPSCTNRCEAYAAYVDGDALVSVRLAEGYEGYRLGPYCAPTASGGIHVVYHLDGQIIYRTVGVP
ncbi:MAG: hypothetical protein JXR96_10895 [Deltaproteobacteria bacterium]|nr:hypothetical protein [Deltaproteobacteria bacterium]